MQTEEFFYSEEGLKERQSKLKLLKNCGIYFIQNKINNHIYIGSSRNIKERFASHKRELRKNTHHCIYLQNAWNKYGEEKFEFIIEQPLSSIEQLLVRENRYIKIYNPEYNSIKVNSEKAFYHSESSKKKISEKAKQRFIDNPSLKLKLINNLKGTIPWNKEKKNLYTVSSETRQKLSKVNKGRKKGPMSEEQKEKIKNTLKGTKLTSEQRQNYLKAKELQKGVNHWSAKKVYQYDLEGNFIREWQYIKEVEKDNLKYRQVYSCLSGHQKTASGFRWFYTFKGNKIESISIKNNQYRLTLV